MWLWCWAWTHGVLGGRYAKRCRTAQGRGEAGQHGEDGDSGAGAGGHVGDGHEALALGELDDQLILLAPAAEAMRVSVSAGSLGPGAMRASSAVSANAGAGAGATTH